MTLQQQMTSPLGRRWIVTASTAFVVGLAVVGCGETATAPPTKEEFIAGKQEQEKIIAKEYGQAAYKKAVATGKAGIK